MPGISPEPVRRLSLEQLGHAELGAPVADAVAAGIFDAEAPAPPAAVDVSELQSDDGVLRNVRRAIELGYAGVLLSGPPGTGKSWYAQQVAVELTGDWEAVQTTQFHPSYQYDDFMFGYRANANGLFEPVPKVFAQLCRDAGLRPDQMFVLVIDEISRSDVVRVFGEALTYLETDKRGREFPTASGEPLAVPPNLFLIGTMNPFDRGVDELDVALERRFAQVDLPPDAVFLRKQLEKEGAEELFIARLITFFSILQDDTNERVRLGHAYFLKCTNIDVANDVWELRLAPTLRRATGFDTVAYERLRRAWTTVVEPAPAAAAGEARPDA